MSKCKFGKCILLYNTVMLHAFWNYFLELHIYLNYGHVYKCMSDMICISFVECGNSSSLQSEYESIVCLGKH